jgi:hypothetical protein
MAKENVRKKHSFVVTINFKHYLNEREALEAAKDLLGGFGGMCGYTAKMRGVGDIDESTEGEVTSIRRGSIG